MSGIRMAATHGALALAVLFVLCYANPEYQALIPNGANVPNHPGVGHVALAGGGTNNQFGLDFASAGESWTTALCQKDSDGDGQSNGLELGDPFCVWSQGQQPARTSQISDPSLASSKTAATLAGATNAPTTAANIATTPLPSSAAPATIAVSPAPVPVGGYYSSTALPAGSAVCIGCSLLAILWLFIPVSLTP